MRFPITLLACLLAAYAASAFLTVVVNPETTFWTQAVEQREAAIEEIRKQTPNQPLILFTGGSSCAFSIDPRIIKETCALPAVNLGLPVACGPYYVLHQALTKAQRGDLLVVCLEPDILTTPEDTFDPTKTGFSIGARQGNFTDAAGGDTFGHSVTPRQYLSLFRPGAKYLITLAGRGVTGKGYRYKPSDIQPYGLIRTDARDHSLAGMGVHSSTRLSAIGRQLMETFAAVAKQKGVRLAYSMPWYFTATEHLPYNRANKQMVLREISEIMPVIDDGFSGAMDGIENFADSGLHLSEKGSAMRSQALADALKAHLAEE